MSSNSAPKVGVIMGSKSDWPVMEHAVSMLERLGVGNERMFSDVFAYAPRPH